MGRGSAAGCARTAPVKQRSGVVFLITSVQTVVGGYIRGQLILSTLIGLVVGLGMFALHVPYAILLGLLAFTLEFIPTVGTLTSGVVCILVAATQSWLLALVVLAYFVLIHVLEGYIVAPRVFGKGGWATSGHFDHRAGCWCGPLRSLGSDLRGSTGGVTPGPAYRRMASMARAESASVSRRLWTGTRASDHGGNTRRDATSAQRR